MQVFDQLAQVLCNRYLLNCTARRNGPPLVLRSVPVAPGKPDTTITVETIAKREATLRPHPFHVEPREIGVVDCVVPNRGYRSQEEYFESFYRAKRVHVEDALAAG